MIKIGEKDSTQMKEKNTRRDRIL